MDVLERAINTIQYNTTILYTEVVI
jgi:hypothetical protein